MNWDTNKAWQELPNIKAGHRVTLSLTDAHMKYCVEATVIEVKNDDILVQVEIVSDHNAHPVIWSQIYDFRKPQSVRRINIFKVE